MPLKTEVPDMLAGTKLATRKDKCGDRYAPGKLGQIFDYGDGEHLAAMFIPEKEQTKGWKKRRAELVASGATVVQNGDLEGTVIFPASDKKTLKLACKLLGVRKRQNPTPRELATRF